MCQAKLCNRRILFEVLGENAVSLEKATDWEPSTVYIGVGQSSFGPGVMELATFIQPSKVARLKKLLEDKSFDPPPHLFPSQIDHPRSNPKDNGPTSTHV